MQIDVETLVELMTDNHPFARRMASEALDDSIIYLVAPWYRQRHKQTFQRIYNGLYEKIKLASNTPGPELAHLREPSVISPIFGWLDFMAPYLDIKQPVA